MKPPRIRVLSRMAKKLHYQWFDHSRGMTMFSRAVMLCGAALVVVIINFDQYMLYILGGVGVLFLLIQAPTWIKNSRYNRLSKRSLKDHEEIEWRLKK